MAKRDQPHPNALRLANPAIRRKMLEVIGKQVPPAAADDVVQNAFVTLMLMVPKLPAADDELLALVVVVTRHKLVDHFRRVAVREGRQDEVDDLDELPEPGVPVSPETRADWDKMLALVEEAIAAGEIPAEALRWARGLAEGKTIAEMAAEDGVSESKIKMVLKRAREKLGPRWRELLAVGSVGLIVLVIALFVRPREPEPGAGPDLHGYDRPPAAASASASRPDPLRVRAEALRELARAACDRRAFAECLSDLDQAAELDPDGDAQPEVDALRRSIAGDAGTSGKAPKPTRH